MNPIRTDGCLTLEDLYRGTDPAKWNITHTFAFNHGSDNKGDYCSSVLIYFLILVINDIIDNNVTFEIPCVGKKEARIYVKCYSGDEFVKLYKAGKFKGIDYIKSGFKGYELTLQGKYNNKAMKEKPIFIDKTTKARFYENINNGKQYY